MTARDAEYVEAERVYRETNRVSFEHLTEKRRYSAALDELVTGEYKSSLEVLLNENATSSNQFQGSPEVATVTRLVGVSDQRSIIAVEACNRPGTLVIRDSADQSLAPPTAISKAFFTRSGEKLLISSSRSRAVDQC